MVIWSVFGPVAKTRSIVPLVAPISMILELSAHLPTVLPFLFVCAFPPVEVPVPIGAVEPKLVPTGEPAAPVEKVRVETRLTPPTEEEEAVGTRRLARCAVAADEEEGRKVTRTNPEVEADGVVEAGCAVGAWGAACVWTTGAAIGRPVSGSSGKPVSGSTVCP